jgi:TonB family protein
MLKKSYPLWTIAFMLLAVSASAQNLATNSNSLQPSGTTAPAATVDNDRVRDGLNGPVRRVRTETAKLVNKNGKMAEGPRVLLEILAYDLKGNKIENAYFPVAGAALTGKEVYKYDDKGNISEMTLQAADGALLGRENYAYEYDFVGNWTKMTTSVAVIESGKLSFEPTEVTYRTITYYLDENVAKMVQPAGAAANSPANVSGATANNSPQASATKGAANLNNKGSGTSKPASAPALPAVATIDRSKMLTETDSIAAVGNVTASSVGPVVKMDAEPPARPAPRPLLRPISGGVLNGSATSLPVPVYPDVARRTHVGGTVIVDVILDEAGKVISARASSGHMLLRETAVQAAMRARFSPTKISGQPVKVSGQITYNFNLAR